MQVKYEPWGINKAEKQLWGVKIVDGMYADTVISINELKFSDQINGDVELDYDYITKTKGLSEEDYKTDEFNKIMSYILEDILRKAIDEHSKDRDSNTTESSS